MLGIGGASIQTRWTLAKVHAFSTERLDRTVARAERLALTSLRHLSQLLPKQGLTAQDPCTAKTRTGRIPPSPECPRLVIIAPLRQKDSETA